MSSTRAHSRKNNVFAFRTFLASTFPQLTSSSSAVPVKVLDVAGGKGDLAWLLSNVRPGRSGTGEVCEGKGCGVEAYVIDPQMTNHSHLEKSVKFLVENEEEVRERVREREGESERERAPRWFRRHPLFSAASLTRTPTPLQAALRATPGTAHHQPLASLLPRLPPRPPFRAPPHIRMHFTDVVVRALVEGDEGVFKGVFEEEVRRSSSSFAMSEKERSHGAA